jgi:proteasome lid subunit RPN8/RPN11
MRRQAPWLKARQGLERWASAGHPHEVCGLLVGRQDGRATRVARVTRGRNLALDRLHDRYTLDPEHFLTVDLAARRAGLEVVGAWHTHPDHPARPSATDRERAWESFSYLILSVSRTGVEDATAWRLAGDVFVEQPIEPEAHR